MIGRRKFLGGALGGLGALSIPLLARYRGLVDPRYDIRPEPRRQGAGGPKRLVIFWNPQGNCTETPLGDKFFPQGGRYDFDLTTSPILAPLAAHAKDMILLRGMNDTYYFHCGEVEGGGVPDGQHGFGCFSRLTNVCPVPAGEDVLGGGPSIDQHLAGIVGGETFVPSLVLSAAPGGTGNHRGFISYSGAGAPVVPQSDPALVYGSLFSAATQGEDDETAKKLRALRLSSLDVIKDEIASIRARIPADERHKMDAHLDGVRVLEKKYDESLAACTPPEAPTGDLPIYPQRLALMLQMAAAALGCDLTRVMTLATSCGGGDNALDISHFDGWVDNYHSTGHAAGGTPDGVSASQEQCTEVMVKVSRYYAENLATFIDLLKALPEGDGSVFDNTIVVWCSEMAHGNHGVHNMPWVVFGGGWHFKPGQYLDLPNSGGFPPVPENKFGDLLVALANAMGSPVTTFGDPAWCDGPGGPLAAMLA